MKFEILEEEDFQQFLDHHPLKNFMQTKEIAALREKNGWKKYYVGVLKENRIVAATLLLSHPRRFHCYEFYAPRGLLVDYEDFFLLQFFVEELKKFIKEKKGYLLRIDPYYVLRERDINGDIVEGGFNHEQALSNLKKLGFRKSKTNEQISWSFSLDLDQDLDQLLKNMRNFTRRSIKKALKNHLTLRDVSYDELPLLKEILDATCSRKNFANRDLSYFQNLYELLGKKNLARFVVADLPLKELVDDAEREIDEEKSIIEKMKKNGSKEEKIQLHEQKIDQIEKHLEEVKILREKYGDVVSASAGIFITYGDEVLYLFGGNIEELMHFGGPHFIQWEMIRYAKENGFKKYNFYGISGCFDPKDASYGVYDFKKGFTGYVEELIGEWELVILPGKNLLFRLIHCLRH